MAEFFDEQRKDQDRVKPTFAETIRQAMAGHTQDLRVAMPAEVIEYDHKKQMVTVKPYFKRKYRDGELADSPMIYKVPVAFPRAGESFIAMPIKKGHTVLLVFSDRSMEKWLNSGTSVDPEDTRAHHISDAIAIPGCYPFSNSAAVANDTDLIVRNANGKGAFVEFRLKENNHLQVLNEKEELVKVLNDMLQILREAVTYTCGGPQKLRHTKFAEIAQRLKTFQES